MWSSLFSLAMRSRASWSLVGRLGFASCLAAFGVILICGSGLAIRKVTKKRGAFPTPDSVRKVLYLAIRKASERWSRPVKDWSRARNHFAIVFEGRVPQ